MIDIEKFKTLLDNAVSAKDSYDVLDADSAMMIFILENKAEILAALEQHQQSKLDNAGIDWNELERLNWYEEKGIDPNDIPDKD